LVEETGGLEKTTDLSQVTDKLYHIMFYTSLLSRFEITTSVNRFTQYNLDLPKYVSHKSEIDDYLYGFRKSQL
jgi:hypothetical protein